jgi:hypothetical protein
MFAKVGVIRALWPAIALGLCAAVLIAAGQSTTAPSERDQALLMQATNWIRNAPGVSGKYEYYMTARVRLLFFWITRDDVGGGTIRRGTLPDDSQRELISLLIGSDPQKAPRRINRWGAAMEVVHRETSRAKAADASAFFGFMTQAKSDASAAETREQMAREKAGKSFLYQAVISHLDRSSGIAKTVPLATEKELDIRQLEPMKDRVFAELGGTGGKYRATPAGLREACPRISGFLASVAELADSAVERGATAGKVCYLHYGEMYTLSLTNVERVAEKRVSFDLKADPKGFSRVYRDLLDLEFEILNHQTGKTSEFSLLMGTSGTLRGAPVMITYQPNFWFRVILHLK